MLAYNVFIALKSLRRNRVLTALIVSGIALGIAVATTFSTVRHVFARDPVPQKSGVLHYVRMDNWDPAKPYPGSDPTRPPTQITHRDMVEIMKSKIPARQTGTFRTLYYVYPDPKVGRPFQQNVRLCFSDFFPMFQTPFRYGSGWDRKADESPESVVVLSQPLNEKLFGGANSVGKSVRFGEHEFRVVGVLDRFRPSVKFYDVTQNPYGPPEDAFIPFNFLRPLKVQTVGNRDGWKSPPMPGFEGFLLSETVWIQMWVELPDRQALSAYQDFLAAYVTEQKKAGRFPRPLNNRVTPLMGWLREQNVVPREATAMMVVALLFLAVSALNLMGLLLGKFLARSAEVGVRRALGARRLDIFLQHLVECELVGLVGGAIGLLLSLGSLALLNKTGPLKDFFHLDVPMALLALALSLVAGLIAGAYPAWRICAVPPAVHLKV